MTQKEQRTLIGETARKWQLFLEVNGSTFSELSFQETWADDDAGPLHCSLSYPLPSKQPPPTPDLAHVTLMGGQTALIAHLKPSGVSSLHTPPPSNQGPGGPGTVSMEMLFILCFSFFFRMMCNTFENLSWLVNVRAMACVCVCVCVIDTAIESIVIFLRNIWQKKPSDRYTLSTNFSWTVP